MKKQWIHVEKTSDVTEDLDWKHWNGLQTREFLANLFCIMSSFVVCFLLYVPSLAPVCGCAGTVWPATRFSSTHASAVSHIESQTLSLCPYCTSRVTNMQCNGLIRAQWVAFFSQFQHTHLSSVTINLLPFTLSRLTQSFPVSGPWIY